ncbi:MAG: PorP/SprF family type IX secretion system membrane protein [Saprospiraceae bacterium]|nr:PorP/SprF family type IX secretion system membrane protein [Saprospiraceae bacterium]MBK9221637.1 PorP/SprF family type IX secretion system membrane protein [Saprospiraceae bacterium]MBK9728489.1 PorP/SprF family type IX secretion system membrane protein [Saprospiraceae bacterium]
MKHFYRYFLFLYVIFYASDLNAQDIHHSQFYTSPLNVNPALTGIFNGDNRFSVNYRRQWFVDDIVRYMTITGSYDLRFYPKKWKTKGFWSGGILFNYDRAGDSKLGLAHLGVSASYTYPLKANHFLTFGGLVGISQRHFNPDELQWDSQWDGDIFDPSRITQEDFTKTSTNFFDFNAGINYRWQKSKRTKLDFGISAYHLNQPKQSFFQQTLSIKLPIRLNLCLTPSFQITNLFDFVFYAQYQNQNPFQEIVFGGFGKFYLNQKRGKEFNVLLGIGTRLEDAIIPKIAIEWKNWYAGLSYDINTSGFKAFTNQQGGPEFSLVHILTKAHPLTVLKSCPIF